jgi:hypothetical protein
MHGPESEVITPERVMGVWRVRFNFSIVLVKTKLFFGKDIFSLPDPITELLLSDGDERKAIFFT